MKEKKECVLNIFNREDPNFKKLFKTCDSYFRELCSCRSVVPSFSFGAATLSGCTINVYQGAYKPAGDSD